MAILDIRKQPDGQLSVSVSGKIDENFRPDPVEPSYTGTVFVRLDGVRALSSQGVRELESFIAALAPRPVVLQALSPAVSSQVAMIPNLFGGAKIESVQLPFTCPQCLKEQNATVPWKSQAHLENAPKCECGTTMELDGLAEMYLPV